jgi:hypothetical protein
MKRLIYSAALSFVVCTGPANQANSQTSSVILTTTPVAYSVPASSLKALSYGDLKYDLSGEWIQLQKGEYHRRDKPFGGEDADVQDVWFFDESNRVPQRVLVSILDVRFGGSSAPKGYVLLFEIRNGALTQTAEFEFDAQAPGTGAKFAGSQLIIVARSGENEPNCCPKHVDVVTYSWKVDKFQQAEYLVKPVRAR